MISRIRKSIGLSAGDRRIAARMTLGFVAAILCLMLALAGTSLGLTGAFVAAQPSPSGSASPPGPPPVEGTAIQLLNPSGAYRPVAQQQEPPRPDPSTGNPTGTIDPPKISDKFDGRDTAYHVVAVVNDPPPTALVELYYQDERAGQSEITIGEMTPVAGSPDTYEYFWQVPNSIAAYFGTLKVRMYEETPTGFEEVGADEEYVRLQHREGHFIDEPRIAEAETVEMTWPSMNGPLGFYKPAGTGTVWRTVVEGLASPNLDDPTQGDTDTPSTGADQVRVFYSTTPPGAEPKFTLCASTGSSTGGPGGAETWAATCALAAEDRPSQVTALAAVAMQNQARQNNAARYSQESADVHRVQPYLQRVEEMTIDLATSTESDSGRRRHTTQGASNSTCMAYRVTVKDALDRPVQGANVDVHLKGPGDAVQFGREFSQSVQQTSGFQKPQKGHSAEVGRDCDTNGNYADLQQGDHNVPGADDIKHLESAPTGTGLSGGRGTTFGQWQFHVWSSLVGDTAITAWVDDEPVTTDTEKREADDDLLDVAEASDTNFVQWLPSAVTVTLDPVGVTAAAGVCQKYIVRARAGTRPVRGANVDVHATGPTDDLDFCDPGDASPRRAPTGGTGHNAEDAGEAAHAGAPPVAQHTEGVSNDEGNFIIGVTSPVSGDTTLTAWYDSGEDGFDNDVLDSGEASGSATTNWVTSTGDAVISFVNPSPYGGSTATAGDGTRVARTQDADSAFHIVSRVASISPVDGVEFFVRTGSNPLVKLGDGTRVGETDTYELYWPVGVSDNAHTLVARITNTTITAEQAITVNNNPAPPPPSPPDPQDVPYETAEITSPLNGQVALFTNRRVTVRGVASAGAEGVDLYYTKASSLTTPDGSAWTSCGFAPLGAGSAPKEFTGDCVLQGSDQPGLVTGIAAITYDCVQSGCNAAPGAVPGGGRNPGQEDSGDAHRVFGVEARPLLAMEPAETAATVGPCVKFVVSLTDQTRQPIPGQNLDVHMTGPGNSGNFCAPEDGTGTSRRAPDQGDHTADGDETDEAYHEVGGGRVQHTEGDTTGNGRLVFGIESETAGDTQLTLWLDSNDNDVFDEGETSDISVMHWEDDTACDITGTDGPDVLEGSDASETICGFGGDDVIRGGGGDDDIAGGAGNDSLRGNAGSDRVRGGAGNDKVFGGGGDDDVAGGADNDTVKGHAANDRLRGNRGNDTLAGGSGRDNCGGGAGRDRLRTCETGARTFALRTRPI
ncbi:MAG: hypothetical protein M3134_08390 [Actinomycetota bacterium]|nr:hypothetical protein [Actinomycetota bacterium]